jgi:glucan phosphoethanolaminetransferase (alkaline phosphatase superfamily)
MIQRPQTLFLLGIIILQIILFFTPLMTAVNSVTNLSLTLYSTTYSNAAGNVTPVHDGFNIWMTCLNGLSILLAAITIFLFRNRMLQLRISRFAGLIIIVLIGMMFYAAEQAKNHVATGAGFSYNYQYGIFLPIVSLILVILAGRGIISDERLVRSADRLR